MTVTVLIALAAWRLWRLAALDAITDRLREPLTEGSWPHTFLTCPWCLGTWLTIAITVAVVLTTGTAAPVLVGTAAAGLCGAFGTVDKWWAER